MNLYKPNNAYNNVDLTVTFKLFFKEENFISDDFNSFVEMDRKALKDVGYTKIQERNLTFDGFSAHELFLGHLLLGEASYIYFINEGKLYEMEFNVRDGICRKENVRDHTS